MDGCTCMIHTVVGIDWIGWIWMNIVVVVDW